MTTDSLERSSKCRATRQRDELKSSRKPCKISPPITAVLVPPSRTKIMGRPSNVARTARRAYMMLNGQFQIRICDNDAHLDHGWSCPYCNCAFDSCTNRDRHVMMKLSCRTQHMKALQNERRAQQAREYQTAGPSSQPLRTASRSGASTRAENGSEHRYNDPRRWDENGRAHQPGPSVRGGDGGERGNDKAKRWDDNGRTCGQPYVEKFPISTAGKPIAPDQTYPNDLGAYLKSCGSLADLQTMEAAEQMMTTGLSAGSRTRFLQSSFVSKHLCHGGSEARTDRTQVQG
jgi:hypothetical protein